MTHKVKHLGISVVLVSLLFATTAIAEPTPYEGKIVALRLNTGESPARVSVRVEDSHQSRAGCISRWYAFENADQDIGRLWTTALMIALHEQKQIYIEGNDRCDSYNVEGIDHIDMKR